MPALLMEQITNSDLVHAVRGLDRASQKLLVITAPKGGGKSALLRRIGSELEWSVVNVGRELSTLLLNLTSRQRRLKAEELIGEMLDATGARAVCLDNTEILFDRTLELNPLRLLLNLARNRAIVATWLGQLDAGNLVYAHPGHPEYFSSPANGFPIVTIADDKLHLFLRP